MISNPKIKIKYSYLCQRVKIKWKEGRYIKGLRVRS